MTTVRTDQSPEFRRPVGRRPAEAPGKFRPLDAGVDPARQRVFGRPAPVPVGSDRSHVRRPSRDAWRPERVAETGTRGADRRTDRRSGAPEQRPAAGAGTRVLTAPGIPGRTARPARRVRKSKAVSHRGRRTRRDRGARVNNRLRTRAALALVLTLLAVALVRLGTIQTVDAKALATAGAAQGVRKLPLYAERGSIDDRNGTPLAFSVQGRSIAARPPNFQNDVQREKVADILVAALGTAVNKPDLMTKMKSKSKYVYLVRSIMPAMSESIMAKIAVVLRDKKAPTKVQDTLVNAVAAEVQQIRTAPDGTFAAAVVGTTGRNGHGLAGIESKFDALLNGKNGFRTLQVDSTGSAIPNTTTTMVPAVDGTGIRLTLDADLQYTTQRLLEAQVVASQARGGCAVIKGISDGQIYAIACSEPGKTAAEVGNPAVGTPFEPGSVNKVVTFAAALERGIITPTTALTIDGQISMGGREIHDAWVHGPIPMTATGILAKSSNVGTLTIAQRLGPTVFAQELAKYGLGRKTGIELPGESAGSYPAQSQWSATSFANLPIGQGISMTLVQLVDMYQAIGNNGVLLAPTVIAGTTEDGVYTPAAPRASSRVMNPKTATTLLGMLRATVQHGDINHRGTGKTAAIAGYQVAGKTGTAQQVDPVTHAYSATLTTATFAGVVPADNPRYAIAMMLDAPKNGSEGGDSAAPLFHKIAAYALRAADVPPSPAPAPVYDLYLNRAG